MKNITLKNVLLAVTSLILLYFLVDVLRSNVNPQLVTQLIKPLGVFAPVLFGLFLAVTNIIPPLPVVPFWLVALTVFERPKAIIVIYLANVLGNTANYLIAKYLGKPTVTRIVGKSRIAKIEEITNGISGFKEFLVIRVFGGGLTDYISYAAGFTNIKPLAYTAATLLGLIPVTFVGIVVLSNALKLEKIGIVGNLALFYIINYLLALIAPTLIFARKYRKK